MESKYYIITFVFGLVTGLSVNMITHIFTKIRDEKNNFLRLTDDLRKPFIEAKSIFAINTGGIQGGWIVEDFFASLHSDQGRNIQALFPYITKLQRKRLQRAWSEYEYQINKEKPSSWFNGTNLYKKDEDIIKKRERCITHLDSILFFFDYQNMFSIFKIVKRLKC